MLPYNQIVEIDSNAFAGLSQLFYLDLSYNPAMSVASDAFGSLSLANNVVVGSGGYAYTPTLLVSSIH